ncbi:MAG: hypothetical protein K1X86_09085 [Ignavibacteria bacterium]|nr:hypothetical protein [Ignavibacteria bacterium]
MKFLILLTFFFLLSSCSSDDYKKLHGTWTNGSIYLIFVSNDAIHISTNNDSIPEFSGSYSINGSDLFVTFSSGQIPDSCLGEGKYEYKINAIALNLDFIRDDCPFRKEQFAKTFKKVK